MVYSLSYQMYKYEHGLTAAEQRAADTRAGEGAAAVRDLRQHVRRTLRPVRLARRAAAAMTGAVAFPSSVR